MPSHQVPFIAFLLLIMNTFLLAKTPVILDTDMGFDDWVAVLYVLSHPSIDVKAITIDCNGLTYCKAGGINAAKLATLVHHPVPIYLGQVDKKETAYRFPTGLREYSSKMAVPGFTHLTGYAVEKSKAAEGIFQLALQADKAKQPLIILSIGTAVNTRDALSLAKHHHKEVAFKKGILRIDKAGGAFGLTRVQKEKTQLTNHNIQGNLTIPGFFASNNTMAEWNIYAAVNAMKTLMQSGIPITWIAINASDQAHITPSAIHRLEKAATHNQALQFSVNAAKQLIQYQGGWQQIANNLDFWDTSAVIAALNPDVVSERHEQVNLCIVNKNAAYQIKDFINGISHGNTVPYTQFTPFSHYYYGTLIVETSKKTRQICHEMGQEPIPSRVIKQINVSRFYDHFVKFG